MLISYKYPAYRTTFRLMAENVIAPPGEFRKLIHLKEDFKLRLLIDVCTIFAGVLVSDSCYINYLFKFRRKKKKIKSLSYRRNKAYYLNY